MTVEQICAVIAVVFSLIAGGFALHTHLRSLRAEKDAENRSVVRALQGEKESVIYIAHLAASGKFDERLREDPDFHGELVHALCVSWPMESSGRARAAIFKALDRLMKGECRAIITETLQDLHHSFRDYQLRFQDEGIQKKITDLTALCAQLGVNLPAETTSTELPIPPSGSQFHPPVNV